MTASSPTSHHDASGLRSDLVRVVNQISENFSHYPHDEAVSAVANHLRRFWAPSMRSQFLEHLDSAGLDPLAVEAGHLLKDGVGV
ncbi:MAG: formate dehydrogenase subunit delta [Acidimicrobiaceae bacterium]|nr:formate dehydrogenase subunit delta [Acidimicrobiaceae bacterium]